MADEKTRNIRNTDPNAELHPDPELEIPDPEQVEADIEQADKVYGKDEPQHSHKPGTKKPAA
jgi:hypothetical protein